MDDLGATVPRSEKKVYLLRTKRAVVWTLNLFKRNSVGEKSNINFFMQFATDIISLPIVHVSCLEVLISISNDAKVITDVILKMHTRI